MTPQALIYWTGMALAFTGGLIWDGIGPALLAVGTASMVWAICGDKT